MADEGIKDPEMTAREIANFYVMWDDAIVGITGAAIVAAGTSTCDATYPNTNLLDGRRDTVAKFTGTGTIKIAFDLLTAQNVYGVGIHNHTANTHAATTVALRYGSDGVNWTEDRNFTIASTVGDDDVFAVFATSPRNYRYFQVQFSDAVTANLTVGRIYLARAVYDFGATLQVGTRKGYVKRCDVTETKGGVEFRLGRGRLRRRIVGVIPGRESAARSQMKSIITACDLNEKPLVTSSPYGTTVVSGTNYYGAAIHGRFASEEWLPAYGVLSIADLPVDIIEVL